MTGASGSLFQRLPHGGHVDLNLSTNGRLCLLVNSRGDVTEVLAELDTVRDALQQLADGQAPRPVVAIGRAP